MGATSDIFTSKYAVTITAILVAFGALTMVSQQKEGSLSFSEAQNIDYDTDFQIIDDSTFELPQVFSFGADGAVNPDESVTYETGVKYNADSSYCQSRDSDYVQEFAVWLEGEGLGNGEAAWLNQGKHSVWINCDGTFKDVSIDINAPQTVGEYDYTLKTAPNNFITQYPMFYKTSHWAGSTDTLKVTEPVTEPTSRISLSTHSAEINEKVSVSTQSTGDITSETLTIENNGEIFRTLDNFDEKEQESVALDESGEWEFTLETEYEGEQTYQDSDSATVNVDAYEEIKAEISISSSSQIQKGDNIDLDASGSSGEGSLSYTWYVNGNQESFSENADYTVQESGDTIPVELEVEDSVGQLDTATDSITVEETEKNEDDNNEDNKEDEEQNQKKTVFVIDQESCVQEQINQDVVLDPSFNDLDSCESYLENQVEDDSDFLESLIDFLVFWK